VGVVQRQIANISDFAGFFPDSIKLLRPPFWGARPDVLVGWGLRRSGVAMSQIAGFPSCQANLLLVRLGFFGLAIAERAAHELAPRVLVLERRAHVGGNAWGDIGAVTGIPFHTYGSYLFHTNSKDIWDYLNRFTAFTAYRRHVHARYRDKIYPMPINSGRFCSFFGGAFAPNKARALVVEQSRELGEKAPANLEEKAISLLGRDRYEAFIRCQTAKWLQTRPRVLLADTLTRPLVKLPGDWAVVDNPAGAAALSSPQPGIQCQLAPPASLVAKGGQRQQKTGADADGRIAAPERGVVDDRACHRLRGMDAVAPEECAGHRGARPYFLAQLRRVGVGWEGGRHGYAVRGKLQRKHIAERAERGLRRGVGGKSMQRGERGRRGDKHHVAHALSRHGRHASMQQVERATKIDRQRRSMSLWHKVEEAAWADHAGAGNDPARRTMQTDGALAPVPQGGLIADIKLHRLEPAPLLPEGSPHRRKPGSVPGQASDPVASPDKLPGDVQTDATRRAANDTPCHLRNCFNLHAIQLLAVVSIDDQENEILSMMPSVACSFNVCVRAIGSDLRTLARSTLLAVVNAESITA
jgi:hypothetical protein